ncbi:MAG: hypothetical protein AAF799_41735 [Myxococcota bacterium]
MVEPQESGWAVVADAGEVCDCRPVVVRRFGESLVLWRGPDGQLHAQLESTALSEDDPDPCAPLQRAEYREVREVGGWIWQWRGPVQPFYPVVPRPAVRANGVATTSAIECEHAEAEALAQQARRLGGPGTMTMVVTVDDQTARVYLRSFRQTPALLFVRRMVGAFEHFIVRRRIGARGRLLEAGSREPSRGVEPVPSRVGG